MGKRKGRKEDAAENLNSRGSQRLLDDDESFSANIGEEGDGEAKGKFFACYLLTSLSPRFKGHTYIGFTVNPRRRIRQHNGEITSGAWRTKKRRPWEMVLCIYGFPTNVAALQFEWAWQHPVESVAVRQAAATFKSLSGLANKIKLVHTMLNLPSWQSLNLTVNYFSTKYIKHAAGCPSLPEHMRLLVCTIDDLPCYTEGSVCVNDNDELNSADDNCEPSGGAQESMQHESVEAQQLNDVTVVQYAIEHDQRHWAELGGDMGVSRLSDQLLRQPKNLEVGEKEVHEQSLQFNECSVKAPLLSVSNCSTVITIAEDTEVLRRHGCPSRAPSLSVSSCNKVATIAEHKERIFRLLDECIGEHDQVEHQQTGENTVSDQVQCANISPDVEVIDVFTPSPFYKGKERSKKRRLSETEIIDLTISPLYV